MTPYLWMPDRVVQVLGWTLVHFIWQGALVALLLAIALLTDRSRAAEIRHRWACFALLALVLFPMVTAFLGALQPTFWPGAEPPLVLPHSELTARMAPESSVAHSPGFAAHGGSAPAGEPVTLADRVERTLPMLVAGWLVGALLLSVRVVGAFAALGWVSQHRARPAPAEVLERVVELARRLGLNRSVAVLESSAVTVPCVVGCLRAAILLPPSALIGLSPRHLDALLTHELAHVLRHDALINSLQLAVETLLFYHPAVWWVSHVIRTEREHCCDDLAIQVLGDPVAYARALTTMEELRTPTSLLAPAATGGSLSARIRRVLGRPPAARQSDLAGWAGAFGLATALGLLLAVRLPAARANSHPTPAPPAGETRPHAAARRSEPIIAPTPLVQPVPPHAGAPSVTIRPGVELNPNSVARPPLPPPASRGAGPPPPTDPTQLAAGADVPAPPTPDLPPAAAAAGREGVVRGPEPDAPRGNTGATSKPPTPPTPAGAPTPPAAPPAPAAAPAPPAPPAHPAPAARPAPPTPTPTAEREQEIQRQVERLAEDLAKPGLSDEERQRKGRELRDLLRTLLRTGSGRDLRSGTSTRVLERIVIPPGLTLDANRARAELEVRRAEEELRRAAGLAEFERRRAHEEARRSPSPGSDAPGAATRDEGRGTPPARRPAGAGAGARDADDGRALVREHLQRRLDALVKQGDGDSPAAALLRQRLRELDTTATGRRSGSPAAGIELDPSRLPAGLEEARALLRRSPQGLRGRSEPPDPSQSIKFRRQMERLQRQMEALRQREEERRRRSLRRAPTPQPRDPAAPPGPRETSGSGLEAIPEAAMSGLRELLPQLLELRRLSEAGGRQGLAALEQLLQSDSLERLIRSVRALDLPDGGDRKELDAVLRGLTALRERGGVALLRRFQQDPASITDADLEKLLTVLRSFPGVEENDIREIRRAVEQSRRQTPQNKGGAGR